MNQIIPKSALKITNGGEPSNYKYTGDSGTFSEFETSSITRLLI